MSDIALGGIVYVELDWVWVTFFCVTIVKSEKIMFDLKIFLFLEKLKFHKAEARCASSKNCFE